MAVRMDHEALDDALHQIEYMADHIETARMACLAAIPHRGPELPSMTSGPAVTSVTWLREEIDDPITVVRDLARLLDTEGNGAVTWDGSSTGSMADIKEELGQQLAEQLENPGDIEDPDQLEEYMDALDMLGTYSDDIHVSNAFAMELGPEGVADVLNQAAAMTGPNADFPHPNDYYEDHPDLSYGEVYERVVQMQDGLAGTLAATLATASANQNWFPEDQRVDDAFGQQMVEHGGPHAASILFDYADRGGHVMGTDFLNGAGNALVEWENGEGGMYWSNWPQENQFGTSDSEALRDPVVQWMEALSLNPEASQEQLLDEGRAAYLLDRPSPINGDEGSAAGRVLQSATIDQALNADESGQNAATISSWAIEHYGGDAEPPEGAKEEMGGIIATYIRDVDAAIQTDVDIPAGTYGPGGEPRGLVGGEGFPPYGLQLDRSMIEGVLGDIGDNDSALTTVSGAANRLNDARLANAMNGLTDPPPDGQIGLDDPLYNSVRRNGGLSGFVLDNMLEGGIESATEDDARRRRLIEMALVPTGFIEVPGGPVGSYVVGQVKNEVTNALVGNGAGEAVDQSNDAYDAMIVYSQQQALQALVNNPDVPSGELSSVWPQDSSGSPVAADDLSATEWQQIVNVVGDGNDGYATVVYNSILDGNDDFLRQYGNS